MMIRIRTFLICLLSIILILTTGCVTPPDIHVKDITLPNIDPFDLTPFALIESNSIKESSGIVKSGKYKNVFWTHSDSGNTARIFPITENGKNILPENSKKYRGIRLKGAVNTDWEDIAADNRGNLIIADFGNNFKTREILSLYIVQEPDPYKDSVTEDCKRIRFFYPGEIENLTLKSRFNAEALFWSINKLYVLTKQENGNTRLYRFDSLDTEKNNPLTLLDTFNIHGQVTGADSSPDGKTIAVLTYNSIWLFTNKSADDNFFNGRVMWLPIRSGQCEAICISGENLILTNENRDLFKIPKSSLKVIQ